MINALGRESGGRRRASGGGKAEEGETGAEGGEAMASGRRYGLGEVGRVVVGQHGGRTS